LREVEEEEEEEEEEEDGTGQRQIGKGVVRQAL
jgi:hypothetical protein